MNDTAQCLVKKYAVLAGILSVFFALFFGLSYLRKNAEAEYLTAAADKLCRTYPEFNGKDIAVLGPANLRLSGLSGLPFRTVLSASYSGRAAFVFLLPVTGKYGVYSAVFFYEKSIGCVFCGLAGIDALPAQAKYYGITQTTLAMHRKNITTMMQRQQL